MMFTTDFQPSVLERRSSVSVPPHRTQKTPDRRVLWSCASALGSTEVVDRLVPEESEWLEQTLCGHAKDARYYEICMDTIQERFVYQFFILKSRKGEILAIQPSFLTDQDLLGGLSATLHKPVDWIRKVWPRFLNLRMLMLGCTAGEAHLAVGPSSEYSRTNILDCLFDGINSFSRFAKVQIITFKDFARSDKFTIQPPAERKGFIFMPSFPATSIPLHQYKSFDDYLQHRLGKAMRKNLRRKFRHVETILWRDGLTGSVTEHPAHADNSTKLIFEVSDNVEHCVDEVHALYQQVFQRSKFRFEELTPSYFVELGRRMPDRARFFLWRCAKTGDLVACSACMVHDGTLYDNYLGLDYKVALDWHLYFVTIRDVMSWAISQGVRQYYSTPLNYEPKLHLKFDLAPLDLYVRHVSDWVNPFFARIAPMLEPTRYDRFLRKFSNFSDLNDVVKSSRGAEGRASRGTPALHSEN